MKYIRIILGQIRAILISLISLGRFSFTIPIRFSSRASVECGNGRIVLKKRASCGKNTHLYTTNHAIITIGSYSGIGDNNVIVARERITIGSNVMIGPNVCIYDHDHVFKQEGIMRDMGFTTAPVTIEDNVWLGAGVIVLKGVTIGSGSVVAAGTVVTKDIPPNTIVYGKQELVMKPRV